MEYKVIGKTCNCSGKPVELILRTATEKDLSEYRKQGTILPNDQAVMACPMCGGCTINWLFLNQNVKTALWALSERYAFEPIEHPANPHPSPCGKDRRN